MKFSIVALCLLIFLCISPRSASSGENDTYNFEWLDPDKVVYVLQNKAFEKKFTWYLNVGYGFSTDVDFQDAKTLQGKTGFYWAEEWGIELLYSSVSNKDSQTME